MIWPTLRLDLILHKKTKPSIKDLLSKYDQILSLQFPTNLLTFTEETLNGKLYFFCAVR